MNLKMLGTGASQLPSIIKDPFSTGAITCIRMRFEKTWSSDPEPLWSGAIEFKNGNTSGEQKFNNLKTLDDVVAHIKAIVQTLQNK